MALKGTLKDFGIADIFQLIGQQGKTGVLHLADGDEQVHVHFKDGNVVKAECAQRKRKELLGDMLVRAGLINERQLQEALDEQKRTLKRLGDVLVGSGVITRDALKQMTQLQTTETLYKLFAWKSGTYEFEVTEVEFDPESVTPVRSESVLMEGFRRVDEWPMIRKRISSASMTFQRLKELADKPAGKDDLDGDLDAAFGEFEEKKEEPEKSEGEFKNLGANERLVFKLAYPGCEVQTIIDRSRLGEFEACKALLNLVNLGYLKALSGGVRAREGGLGGRERWTIRLVHFAGRVATALLLLGLGALVAARYTAMASPGREKSYSDPTAMRLVTKAQLARIESALAVFTAANGEPPEKLEELVGSGILSEGDLRYPWDEPYHYRKSGKASYVLLPPLN